MLSMIHGMVFWKELTCYSDIDLLKYRCERLVVALLAMISIVWSSSLCSPTIVCFVAFGGLPAMTCRGRRVLLTAMEKELRVRTGVGRLIARRVWLHG